jgi:hypothetical protein
MNHMDRMAAPGGYNPAVSLLPAASGTIHAMSGGSYNPQASMLPSVTGAITGYRGGAIGGQPTTTPLDPSSSSKTTAETTAETLAQLERNSKSYKLGVNATTNPIESIVASAAVATAAVATAPVATAPVATAPVGNAEVATAAVGTLADAIEEPGQLKTIILFQQSLKLRDPRQFIGKEDAFVLSPDERKALELFGVDEI